jgi:hypothetical protein
MHCQKELMKDPTSLEANTMWVWSLLRKGRTSDAFRAFNLTNTRIKQGLIVVSEESQGSFGQLEAFIAAIKSAEIEPNEKLNERLMVISSIYS